MEGREGRNKAAPWSAARPGRLFSEERKPEIQGEKRVGACFCANAARRSFSLASVPSEELQSHRRGVFGATATPRSPHPSTRGRSAEGMLAIGKN